MNEAVHACSIFSVDLLQSPQAIVEVVDVLDAYAVVLLFDVLSGHCCDAHGTCVHSGLCNNLDNNAGANILHCTSRACQAWTHDVGTFENKVDRTLVNLQLRHHRWVLVQEPQGWQPRTIALLPKERNLVDNYHGDVVLALADHHHAILRPNVLENSLQSRELLQDALLHTPLN